MPNPSFITRIGRLAAATLVVVILTACQRAPEAAIQPTQTTQMDLPIATPEATQVSPSPAEPTPETPPPGAEPGPVPLEATVLAGANTLAGETALAVQALPPFAGQALPVERGKFFSGSGACAACHTRMQDQAGQDVSTDALWRSTMMANAARDPYWQASVRAEVLQNPALAEVIEDKCAACHLPMARFSASQDGQPALLLDEGFLNPAQPLHALGMDGVSCTLCHQVEAQGFGLPESFSGRYAIDAALPQGERLSYGPFDPPPQQALIMQSSSGFIPLQSEHILQSEQCATCHTLYTPFVNRAGEVLGEFPEQTPYLEWLNSSFRETASCQGCHMPLAQGGVQLSITGGPLRQPVAQHVFVGGNTFALRALRAFGPELGVTASSAQLEATLGRAQAQLANTTARVAIENAALTGETLVFDVLVQNLAGHKFPTGFPSRRAWLHVVIKDAAGQVVFESGGYGPDGLIQGNDNDLDAALFEPHYTQIEDPSQVQIYEAIIGEAEGQVTTTLLYAASYLKDNRLLPAGWEAAAASADIAPQGVADADFTGGSERVAYRLPIASASGPFTIQANLCYQSVGYRWAQNLAAYPAAEVERFLGYYEQLGNPPELAAGAAAQVGK